MVLNNYNTNPEYPDRYNRRKRWVKVLPVQGRPIQTAEITELQSILLDNLKQGFDSLFKNGSIIRGLRMNVVQRDDEVVTVSVTEGQVYVEGMFLDTETTSVTVSTTGIFNVGVRVNETIITEEDDESLRDPIKGGSVRGPAGASRLVWTPSIVVFETDSNTIGTFFAIGKVVDGIVVQKELNPFYRIEELLSTYIYERSGNFCVNGFEITNLGITSRTSTDQTRFADLQTELSTAQNEQQDALALAVEAQNTVNTLTTQLNNAILAAQLTPTLANQTTVSNLTAQLQAAESRLATTSSNVLDKQTIVNDRQSAVEKQEALLVDREIISIAPGIAYVEGHRVAQSSPNIIYIPRDLPTTTVESARFTYQGTPSQALRSIDGSNPTVVGQTNSLEITITNIPNNPNFNPYSALSDSTFGFYVRYLVPAGVSVPDAVTNLVTELQTTSSANDIDFIFQLLDASQTEVTLDNAGNTITSEAKKNLLIQFIEISKQGTQNLFFKATSINNNFDQSIITIQSQIYDTVPSVIDPNGPFTVDIETASFGASESTNIYKLGFRPVAQVNSLVAELESPPIEIVRSLVPGTADLLGQDTVFRIVEVYDNSTTYVEDIDYRLINQSQIDWSINLAQSTEPAGGNSYFVKYVYTESLSINQDFVLNEATDSIEFVGRTPGVGRGFTVDYTYYLAKAGLITLDKDGRIQYVLSDAAREPLVPPTPPNLLALASFKLYADRLEATQLECRRLTVQDLYDLSNEVKQNTKNTEAIMLDLKAIQGAETNGDQPVGVYTEPGLDLSKIDVENSQFSIVPATRGYTLSYIHNDVQLRAYSPGASDPPLHENELLQEEYVTLPYTETTLISQERKTRTRELPLYSSTLKKRATMLLSQYISFGNDDLSVLSGCDVTAKIGTQLTTQQTRSDATEEIIQTVRNTLGNTGYRIMESFDTGKPVIIADTDLSKFEAKAYDVVNTKSVQIVVRVENLPPSTNGFIFLFNGQKINFSLTDFGTNAVLLNGTATSTTPSGSAQSNSDGTVHFRYTLPSDLPTGVHSFELYSEGVGYAKSFLVIYNNLLSHMTLGGLASWNAIPISTSSTMFLPRQPIDVLAEDLLRLGVDATVFPEALDNLLPIQQGLSQQFPPRFEPLLQTYTAPDYFFLTSVDLFINNGPVEADSSLQVNLKGTSPDLPTKDIILSATAQSYTFDGTGTNPTNFSWPFPVPVERNKRYSLGVAPRIPLATDSSTNWSIFTGVVNEPDIDTGAIIANQLYVDGELFTSEDGVGLILRDREDLKFELKRANFDTTSDGIVNFGLYGSGGDLTNPISYFSLNTRNIIPPGTDITYEFRVGAGAWIKFKPNTLVCAENQGYNQIEIRAILASSFTNLSPMLMYTGAYVSLYSHTLGSYVQSRQVTYPEAYQNIKITLQYITPADTSISVLYSPTDGFAFEGPEWLPLTLDSSTVKLVDAQLGLYEATYTRVEPTEFYVLAEERRKFRFRVGMNSTNYAAAPVVKNIQSYVF